MAVLQPRACSRFFRRLPSFLFSFLLAAGDGVEMMPISLAREFAIRRRAARATLLDGYFRRWAFIFIASALRRALLRHDAGRKAPVGARRHEVGDSAQFRCR